MKQIDIDIVDGHIISYNDEYNTIAVSKPQNNIIYVYLSHEIESGILNKNLNGIMGSPGTTFFYRHINELRQAFYRGQKILVLV